MDSKAKKLTVFAVLGILLVITLTVVLVNYKTIFGYQDADTQTSTVQKQVQIDENGMVLGADLSGFLKDETFFDHEDRFSEYQTTEQAGEEVTLLATSVEKDIRITVVGTGGEPVTGENFEISLNDEDTYSDLDHDGIIYVADLKPGDYSVTLNEIDGFYASTAPLQVNVKENIEYSPIADISYLIHTEDEIDVEAEDTEEDGLDPLDCDDTEYTDILQGTDTIQMGVDVSKWNGDIDWDVVKAEGIEFAIIRCGYRGSSTGALVQDPYFVQNLQNAKRAGLKVGLYFFTQAVNDVEAVEEASMAVSLLQGVPLEYPIFIDTEGAGGNGRADGLSVEERTNVCNAFCQTVENAGYTAGIYASRNWYYNALQLSALDDYYIWLAEYRETPLFDGHYEMWQYTSNGHVEGISGRVDLDIGYKEQ